MAKQVWQTEGRYGYWAVDCYLYHSHTNRPEEHAHMLSTATTGLRSRKQAEEIASLLNQAYEAGKQDAWAVEPSHTELSLLREEGEHRQTAWQESLVAEEGKPRLWWIQAKCLCGYAYSTRGKHPEEALAEARAEVEDMMARHGQAVREGDTHYPSEAFSLQIAPSKWVASILCICGQKVSGLGLSQLEAEANARVKYAASCSSPLQPAFRLVE